ncbi:MAG: hypothetical protein ACFFCS_21810 [Candidatus Hodarchaeota archaeon]
MSEDLLSKLDSTFTLRCLEDMIRINSIVGQEGELAEYLRSELEALGMDTELDEVESGRKNIYARLKGDISSAESLANVSDPAPLTREKIEIKTAFELKRILDEYRCIPVVLAMESRSAGSMMGNANQIAKQIARKFPGEVQHVKVNLDSTHRVGSFFNVKFIEVGRGEMHLYTEPMTILAIHDGRVVIDWRAYGSYSAKDFYDDMAKYLETGIPIAEHPRTFKTAELLTFDYVHPVLEDFNQLHKPYPLLKRGE